MQWSKIAKRIGLIRSVAMYYWKPFNRSRLRNFYTAFLGEGDLCFDIGAHIGNRAAAWADLGARVIAVEPQEHCVAYMRRKFRNVSGITVLQQAVGGIPGRATLHISRITPTISTLSNDEWRDQINQDAWYHVDWSEEAEVEVTTLDLLIREFGMPVFCKIDVENQEYEVLKGLSRPVPAVSFEYYPPLTGTAASCIQRLEQLGRYEYNWSFGESLRMNATIWVAAEAMIDILSTYKTKRHYGDVYARLYRDSKGPALFTGPGDDA